MATIIFQDGTKVNFNGDPTPQDVEEVARNLGIKTSTPSIAQKQEGKSTLRKVADFFTSSEQALGRTYGGALATQSKDYQQAIQAQVNLDDKTLQLAKMISANKKLGKDTSRLETQLKTNLSGTRVNPEDLVPELKKTTGQIVGETLGVITDIASAGTYGKAATAAKSGKLLKSAEITAQLAKTPISQVVKQSVKSGAKQGATFGASYSASQALQEKKQTADVIKDTIVGGITGSLIGAGTGYLAGKSEVRSRNLYEQKAKKLIDSAIEQYRTGIQVSKQKYAEMQDKIIPELLNQKTWGTWKSLMQKADDGIALSAEEYKKLGELKGITDITPLLENIDDRMKSLQSPSGRVISINETKYKQLQALKDDIMSLKRGEFVIGNKGISTDVAKSQDLRELAQQYGDSLYETRKAQQTVEDSKTLSQIKRVDGAIRQLLNTENPEYGKVNKLYTFSNNLKDVLLESERIQGSKSPFYGGVDILKKIGSVIAGGTIGSAVDPATAILGASAALSYNIIKSSTWYNTLRAVQKQKLAEKILAKQGVQFSQSLNLLARDGLKYAIQLINE